MTEQHINELADELRIVTEAGRRALAISLNCIAVLDSKQQDYGPRNIADFGELGVLVRVNDKLQRLRNLLEKGADKAKHEAKNDSWLDLSNYGIIGYLIATGAWPNE